MAARRTLTLRAKGVTRVERFFLPNALTPMSDMDDRKSTKIALGGGGVSGMDTAWRLISTLSM
jgi:hypothetical protein